VRISTIRNRWAAGWAYGLLGMLAFAVTGLGEQLPRFPDQVSTLQFLRWCSPPFMPLSRTSYKRPIVYIPGRGCSSLFLPVYWTTLDKTGVFHLWRAVSAKAFWTVVKARPGIPHSGLRAFQLFLCGPARMLIETLERRYGLKHCRQGFFTRQAVRDG
jgi:hypothetical protein